MQLLGVEQAELLVGQQGERGPGMLEGWESPFLSQNSGMRLASAEKTFQIEGGEKGRSFCLLDRFFFFLNCPREVDCFETVFEKSNVNV